MTKAELAARGRLIIRIAEKQGNLVIVTREESTEWKTEWRCIRAKLGHKRRWRLHARVQVKAPRPCLCRAHQPDAALIQPGAWVAFRPTLAPNCPETVCRIVAFVPPGVRVDALLAPELIPLLERHTFLDASSRIARVIVAIPGARRCTRELRTVLAGTLASRGRLIENPSVCGRLPQPIPTGQSVAWRWHSSKGPAFHRGCVLGYIPAGVSIVRAFPGLTLRRSVVSVSNQDRYLVRLTGPRKRKILTPAAHLVERVAIALEHQCAS